MYNYVEDVNNAGKWLLGNNTSFHDTGVEQANRTAVSGGGCDPTVAGAAVAASSRPRVR